MGERLSLRERFESKVARAGDDECWEFQGEAVANPGSEHRQFWVDGSMQLAHRVAYVLYVGPIPDDLCVLHCCDNPPCVNPAHLFLGTVADNNEDRDTKGRHVALHNEDHGSTRITDDQVEAIRELCRRGIPQKLIARAVGISQSHVSNIHRLANRVPDREVKR